ncbi:hypothetical protein [Streptacidiphilus sp. EB103A]|uniref:hypothetical protein n=1 Tax=Streptacidiphilus sp. EB103A TaxID=3156275 RepID=UPI00351112F2
MAFARYLGPTQRSRLERASFLNAACLSGLSVMLLGGAWLPAGGAEHRSGPAAAFVVAVVGLVVFCLGCVAQLGVVIFGRPAFLLSKEGAAMGEEMHSASGACAAAPGSDGPRVGSLGNPSAMAEVAVYRDDADTYAQLRRYDVYIDGKRVGRLRRGEMVNFPVSVGSHAVQVRISWCSSMVLPVEAGFEERVSLICRAKQGASTDLAGISRQRDDFLLLRKV